MFKKITIYTLILAMGLGFFVVQTPPAEALGYNYFGQAGLPAQAIKTNGGNTYLASNNLLQLNDAGIFEKYDLNLEYRDTCVSASALYCAPKIQSIVFSPDGNTIYLGGFFTHVNGYERRGVVAIDSETGQLLSWNPGFTEKPSSIELAISRDGATIYVYGLMSTNEIINVYGATGEKRYTFLKKVDAQTGFVYTWGDEYSDYYIYDLEVDNDNEKLYLLYSGYDNQRGPAGEIHFIELNAITGASKELDFKRRNDNPGYSDVGVRYSPGLSYVSGHLQYSTDTSTLYFIFNESYYAYRTEFRLKYLVSYNTATSDIIYLRLNTWDWDIENFLVDESNDKFYFGAWQNKRKYQNNELIRYDIIYLYMGDLHTGEIVALPGPQFQRVYHYSVSPDGNSLYAAGIITDYDFSSDTIAPNDIVRIDVPSYFSESYKPEKNLVPNKALVKEEGDPTIYFIYYRNKLKVLDFYNFYKEGFSLDDVIEVGDLSLYPLTNQYAIDGPWRTTWLTNFSEDGILVKKMNDSRVYVSTGQMFRWIETEQIFNKLGYEFRDVREVWWPIIDEIPHAQSISTLQHPDGALIKYIGDSRVYLIKNGQKRWIRDEAVFNAAGFKWDRIVEIDADVVYPDGVVIEL